MSTSDQPDTPPLTRRRLREIRNTGATPVIPPAAEEAEPHDPAPEESPAALPAATPPVAPLPRASEPAAITPPPMLDAGVNLGVAPLTRRQAREQERIRTASVPVVAPDVTVPPAVVTEVPAAVPAPVIADVPARQEVDEDVDGAVVDAGEGRSSESTDSNEQQEASEPIATVNPALGSELLAGGASAATLPPSFDSLISRSASASGATSTPNALILSQTPAAAPLVAPVTATGEVIITGSFDLPDGLGSTGQVPGTADGKDLDIALIDGELPASSSPTPIAASAAISTVRNDGEIIRPPAPEKGNRLLIALTITAGALAVAVVGILIYAFTTGIF